MNEKKIISDADKALSKLHVLYDREISRTLHVYIGQEILDQGYCGIKRSQHLILMIKQLESPNFVCMRLSTFRKVLHFMLGSNFFNEPRRLTWLEKKRLDKTWPEVERRFRNLPIRTEKDKKIERLKERKLELIRHKENLEREQKLSIIASERLYKQSLEVDKKIETIDKRIKNVT